MKAFSLFEIIMVMAIVAILMGLGWSGLMTFRATSEMQNAYSELVSVIKTEQNKAKNSLSAGTEGVTPDHYSIFISGNQYFAYNCRKTSTVNNNVRCTKDSTFIARILPQDITINPSSNTAATPFCKGIGFTRLTGKFVSFEAVPDNLNDVNAFDTTFKGEGICTIKLFHTMVNAEKNIELNLDINSLNLP
jgi:prepilin-type N-terminal cleavage/methylation domain-containing protein